MIWYDIYPCFKKFFDDKLPDRCKFFSCFKDECISQNDYLHVIDIWEIFKMNTMGDYHDVYLKTDFLSLADVFEKFISTRLEYYGLNLCHYFILLYWIVIRWMK